MWRRGSARGDALSMSSALPRLCGSPRRLQLSRKKYKFAVSRYGTNVLFGFWSFVELGCPKGARSVAYGELSALQRVASENVAGELLEFVRPDRSVATSALAGCIKRLAHALDALADVQVVFSVTADPWTTPMPVVPEGVALPEQGGVIDPAIALDHHLRLVFNDWERHTRPPQTNGRFLYRRLATL